MDGEHGRDEVRPEGVAFEPTEAIHKIAWFPRYGNPWLYLIGEATLVFAFYAYVVRLFRWPDMVWGGLTTTSALPGLFMATGASADLGYGFYSLQTMRGQLWLYLGLAIPAAVRVIGGGAEQRR